LKLVAAVARQQPLGQGRAVIRRVRLIADDVKLAVEALAAKRLGGAEAG